MAGQPGPRGRYRPVQHCRGGGIALSPTSAAFGRRCSTERHRLQTQLSHQLKDDIFRISNTHLFCDLELEGRKKSILAHRCILEARAPKFYSEHCQDKLEKKGPDYYQVKLPVDACEDLIGDFVRNIYTLEDPSDSEARVVSYLQQFAIVSPGSEAYQTPQCSPGDLKDYAFCEENSSGGLRAKLSRAHYYSLVPVDDICSEPPPRSSDLLQQELEEQDALIRSFQTINENSVLKKPTFLQLSSLQTKNIFQKSEIKSILVVEEAEVCQDADSSEDQDILLSCVTSPCSPITPDMDPPSKALDSGVELGPPTEDHTISSSQMSFSSPLLPKDHTASETSGLSTLDDGKHNCATMASISDAESDHEFPEEPADSADKPVVSTDETSGKMESRGLGEEGISKPSKTESMETKITKHHPSCGNTNIQVADTLIENISVSFVGDKLEKTLDKSTKTALNERESKKCKASASHHPTESRSDKSTGRVDKEEEQMPFCLVTSIEQDYQSLGAGVPEAQDFTTPVPQFLTYDVNRSSNRSSGNFFIDASSLLDDSEISGDWPQNPREDKVVIAGVTTTSTEDIDSVKISNVADSMKNLEISDSLQGSSSCALSNLDSLVSRLQDESQSTAAPSLTSDGKTNSASINPTDLIKVETGDAVATEDCIAPSLKTYTLCAAPAVKPANKLETSYIDPRPVVQPPPEFGSFPSVDMIRSAPAASDSRDRPKSLDCTQLMTGSEMSGLPRRNTFESDIQEHALVQQEMEKKQGQMLFQSSIPAFSQHVTGAEGMVSGNKLPMSPLAPPSVDCYPSMTYQAANALPEEDINSPDSLNNDGPAEDFTKDKVCQPEVVEEMHRDSRKKQKYDESMPIISGGVSCDDFQVNVRESPLSHRRIESTPILSGANIMATDTPTSSPRFPRKVDSTAWIVDMSDPNELKSPMPRRKRQNVINTQLETVRIHDQDPEISRRKNSGMGFFVDISDGETAAKHSPPPPPEPAPEQDKKKSSFFSMYIDIGDSTKPKGEMPKRRPFSRESSREDKVVEKKVAPLTESAEARGEQPKEKQGFYMFIEAEPPVVRRQTVSGGRQNVNRHSWNVAEAKPVEDHRKHKRAQSLCGGDRAIRYDELHKSDSKSKLQQSTQSLHEAAPSDQVQPPKLDYVERSDVKIMTRSMDETMTTEVKLRTGRGMELEPVLESSESRKQFVRLSDLDGRAARFDARQLGDGRPRSSRKVEETSWIESKLLVRGSRSTVKTKSQALANFGACHSPTQDTDESELSSMQSSVDRSGLDASTEETDISSSFPGRGGTCSRLGEDLLRMFLEEINTDVVVEVAGRRIRAHKCILSSRCQYFAAMLSGGWVESAGNVISLQGFSYHAVHFALSHIYSGTNNIPDSLSIVELATLTDMLGLEGLKEVIMYTLKVKYCHFFHKPCSVCAVGVLECLPLAAAYGLDEIYHKSLRWITKYFVRIWPSKAFASLPRELVDKCYLQHVVHMSVDSVLDTVMSCDRLLATLPSVRWAEAIFSLTSQLLDACVTFMSDHFSGVLTSDRFVSLGKELSWNISRLEDSIMAAVDGLPPEQACQSHTKLSRILAVAGAPEPPQEMQWSASFVELLDRIKARVEIVLVRLGARAMRCKAWAMLGASMRTKVQEAACLGHDPEEGRRARSLSLTKRGKRSRGGGSNTYGSTPRYSGGRLIGAAPPCFDLRQVTLAMTRGERAPPMVATVQPMQHRKAPEAAGAEKTTAARNRQARPRAAAESRQQAAAHTTETQPPAAGRPKTWPMKVLEQSKPRPAQKQGSDGSSTTASRTATPEKSAVPARMKASSSESSRTSSPASRDKSKKGPAPRRPIEPVKSASSSHIPIANSKPFLSPVLRGARVTHDSPTSKSVTELTRTKNSPIPALRSRILSRSSQPSLVERRLSSGSISAAIRLAKHADVASSPSKGAPDSAQNSPLRKPIVTKTNETRPPFRLGTSTESLRKTNVLADKPKPLSAAKRPLRSQENVSCDVKSSPRARRLAEYANGQGGGAAKVPQKNVKPRAPIPLSQSSSAPAINKGFKPKLLSASSRSGTFLKDEPTVLKKPVG